MALICSIISNHSEGEVMGTIKSILEKILTEVKPYMTETSLLFIVALVFAVLVLFLHIAFMKYKFVKYIPTIGLIIFAAVVLLKGNKRSILQASIVDMKLAIISLTAALTSFFVAIAMGSMAKRKKSKKSRVSTSSKSEETSK